MTNTGSPSSRPSAGDTAQTSGVGRRPRSDKGTKKPKRFQSVTVEGWIAVNASTGTLAVKHTVPLNDAPGGFPTVWKFEKHVPPLFEARKVIVTVALAPLPTPDVSEPSSSQGERFEGLTALKVLGVQSCSCDEHSTPSQNSPNSSG